MLLRFLPHMPQSSATVGEVELDAEAGLASTAVAIV